MQISEIQVPSGRSFWLTSDWRSWTEYSPPILHSCLATKDARMKWLQILTKRVSMVTRRNRVVVVSTIPTNVKIRASGITRQFLGSRESSVHKARPIFTLSSVSWNGTRSCTKRLHILGNSVSTAKTAQIFTISSSTESNSASAEPLSRQAVSTVAKYKTLVPRTAHWLFLDVDRKKQQQHFKTRATAQGPGHE